MKEEKDKKENLELSIINSGDIPTDIYLLHLGNFLGWQYGNIENVKNWKK